MFDAPIFTTVRLANDGDDKTTTAITTETQSSQRVGARRCRARRPVAAVGACPESD